LWNVDANTGSTCSGGNERDSNNMGEVYYTDGILNFLCIEHGSIFKNLGTPAIPSSTHSGNTWISSSIYNGSNRLLFLVCSRFILYRLWRPGNAAILQAVNDGFLPGTGHGPRNKGTQFCGPTRLQWGRTSLPFYPDHIINGNGYYGGWTAKTGRLPRLYYRIGRRQQTWSWKYPGNARGNMKDKPDKKPLERPIGTARELIICPHRFAWSSCWITYLQY